MEQHDRRKRQVQHHGEDRRKEIYVYEKFRNLMSVDRTSRKVVIGLIILGVVACLCVAFHQLSQWANY